MDEANQESSLTDTQNEQRRSLRPRDSLKRTSPFFDDQSEIDLDKTDNRSTMSNNAADSTGRSSNPKRKLADSAITIHNTPKKPRVFLSNKDEGYAKDYHELSDVYCWECHRECVEDALDCSHCPRTFHAQCALTYKNNVLTGAGSPWTCPVCLSIANAENPATKSWAMQQLSSEDLASVLNFALNRMKHSESTAFHLPVPREIVPDYYDVIFHPMDLSLLEKNIKENRYSSTESFNEDAKWLLHNSVIYNGLTSRYTTDAKLIMKICKHEVSEIELCPDCYLSSCRRKDDWFTEPCTHPHCLVWAKMKGFPYWPAKALRISNLNVDVRFFGAHDRAWIPLNQIFLLSEASPTPVKNVRKFQFDKAIKELELHIEKLKKVPNLEFKYAPLKTELKAEHLVSCPELFGSNLPTASPNRRPLSSTEISFTSEMNASVHCQDNVRQRHFSTTSSTTNSDTTMVNECFEQKQSSSKSIKSPSTTIVLSRKLDKTYSVKRKSDGEDKPAAEEHNAGKVDEKLDNVVEPNSQSGNSDEECLSVFDKMEMILKDGKGTNDESETRMDEETKEKQDIKKRPIVEKTALSALQLSQKLIRAKAKFSSPRNRNGLVLRTNRTIPTKESPKSTCRIGHSRRSENSKPITAKTTAASAENPSKEKSTSKPDIESSKDIKRKTLLSVLARMSDGSGSSLKPILHRLPEQAVQEKITHQSDDEKAKNSEKREPLENSSDKNTSIHYSNKSTMIDNFLQRVTAVLSSSLSDIFDEIHKNAASVPHETSDQPCCSSDTPLSTDQLPSKESEDKLRFFKDAISSMARNSETMCSEMKRLVEIEKADSQKAIDEMKERFEEEKAQAIKETKLKQWCASCGKEAVFYCCWNTSYCNYPCQQLHWPKHQSTCAQIRQNGSANDQNSQLANKNIMTPTFSALPPVAMQHLNMQHQQQSMASMVGPPPSATSNVLPLYAALPTANYYKTTAVPANVTLDINGAVNGGQPFLAIPGGRHPPLNGANVRPTAAYLALRRP